MLALKLEIARVLLEVYLVSLSVGLVRSGPTVIAKSTEGQRGFARTVRLTMTKLDAVQERQIYFT